MTTASGNERNVCRTESGNAIRPQHKQWNKSTEGPVKQYLLTAMGRQCRDDGDDNNTQNNRKK